MTMTRLFILTAMLAALAIPVAPCWAQGGLPDTIVCAVGELADAQKTAMVNFVDGQKAGLTGTDTEVRRARASLVQALRKDCVSVTFRIEYARLLVPVVRPLASHQRELVAINAAQIAGELATSNALEVLTGALKDKRPAVRFAALEGVRQTFGALTRTNPAVAAPQAASVLASIATALAAETDPRVLEAFVLALRAGTQVLTERVTGVRAESLKVLAVGIGAKAQNAALTDIDPALGRAAQAARDALTLVALKEPPLPEAVVKDAAGMAGDILACVLRRVSAGELADAGHGKRAQLALIVADSERTIYFAASRLGGKADDLGLSTILQQGRDDAFRKEVLRVIGAGGILISPPFKFPPDRFVK